MLSLIIYFLNDAVSFTTMRKTINFAVIYIILFFCFICYKAKTCPRVILTSYRRWRQSKQLILLLSDFFFFLNFSSAIEKCENYYSELLVEVCRTGVSQNTDLLQYCHLFILFKIKKKIYFN